MNAKGNRPKHYWLLSLMLHPTRRMWSLFTWLLHQDCHSSVGRAQHNQTGATLLYKKQGCRPAKSHSLGVRLTHFDAVSLINCSIKVYFIWDLTHFVLCNQYIFYIAHMEIELKSHSFKHWNLGSYGVGLLSWNWHSRGPTHLSWADFYDQLQVTKLS